MENKMADFSESKIQDVWDKGFTVPTYDSNKYRKDTCGAWMERDKYGKEGVLGWEIDHVYPTSKGGDSELENLRPMNWANNRSKADDFPTYTCAIKSDDDKNVPSKEELTVNEELKKTLSEKYDK